LSSDSGFPLYLLEIQTQRFFLEFIIRLAGCISQMIPALAEKNEEENTAIMVP